MRVHMDILRYNILDMRWNFLSCTHSLSLLERPMQPSVASRLQWKKIAQDKVRQQNINSHLRANRHFAKRSGRKLLPDLFFVYFPQKALVNP